MSAAMLTAPPSIVSVSPGKSTTASYKTPDALQQLLQKIEDQRNVNLPTSEDLHRLKADLESRWRIASTEGNISSTILYELLEYGWKEWQRITAEAAGGALPVHSQ